MAGREVIALCAIGNPQAFADTLTSCGATVTQLLAFPDHHHFSEHDALPAATAEVVVTAKDAVKLAKIVSPDANWWVMDIAIQWHDPTQLRQLLAPFGKAAGEPTT